jgi:hypothetical protein
MSDSARPSQSRIINGALYSRSVTPYAHDIRVHDLGHGQVEAIIQPRFAWVEVDSVSPGALLDYAECVRNPVPLSPLDLLNRAADNKERATRRARTKVRRLAKFKGLTTLLTLTYRENMQDRERMARDLDVFIKRVRRVVSGFEYIAVFERQKRGAWHAHIAVKRVLSHYLSRGNLVRSYDLLRSMWRGVVGADNGNVDVSRNRRVQRSASKLAAYLSKYIGKEFGQAEKHVNSYSASGRALPPAIIERHASASLWGALCDLFDLLSSEVDVSHIDQCMLEGGGYYLCLSPPS